MASVGGAMKGPGHSEMFKISNLLYQSFIEKSPELKLHKVRGLDLPFHPKWKNIGINLSGGADSACLCMLLADLIEMNRYDCKIHVITFIRCWKTRPWQEKIGHAIFEELKNMHPNIILTRHENYIPPELEYGTIGPIIGGRSGDQIEGSSFNEYISYKHKFDAVFNATSKNPDAAGFENRMKSRDKDPADGSEEDVIFSNKNTVFCHPFRFVQKDWIVAQFHITNRAKLFEATRSCEGDLVGDEVIRQSIPHFDLYKTGMAVPICHTCFWCLERNWAVSRLSTMLADLQNV